MVIFLALFHRYGWIIITLISMFIWNPLLVGAIFMFGFSVWSILGYIFKWKHIYCSYQNAYREKMTPHRTDWSRVKNFDAIGIPVMFLAVSVAMFFIYLVS